MWCVAAMRTKLLYAPCPGFAMRKCLRCKRSWMSTAPDMCEVINHFCPDCILRVGRLLRWEDTARPETRLHEQRVQQRLAELRRAKELSVAAQRREIGKRRRTA